MATATGDLVHGALKNLKDLGDARELMSLLNYQYDSAPLRMAKLPDDTRAVMAGEPQVIAKHGDFKVIHTQFKGQRLPLGHERKIIEGLLTEHPYSLFLFSDDNHADWHFVNVKHEGDKATRVFRRLSVGPDEKVAERLRTPAQQLAGIALNDSELDGLETRPLEIQQRRDKAFDVEVVTKRFYDTYRDVFYKVEKMIGGIEDADRRRLFTQRLFNRLMFVAFVQKKEWLRLNGQTDYLNELWKSYRQSPDRSGFYNGRLKNLFFVALDNKAGRDYMTPGHPLLSVLGDVRYLNGGLFEQNADDQTDEIVVPDAAIEAILTGLFNRFNFTVTESTPLDQEVAVDPEMLGKVFEELVTGRHETGSYYTPKPIVSFMCREALKAYLRAQLPDEGPDSIERFVDEHQPDGLRDPEAILEALRSVTACDPACGSGAYLLGLLHELVELRGCLFQSHQIDHPGEYRRKLDIIQKNLYGVDIDPFAVNIARLRLWLSLAIDYDGPRPEPLPNLDFKIKAGDSLTARHVGEDGQLALRQKPVEEFQTLKTVFLTAHGDDKRRLYADIQVARKNLADLTHGGATVHGFDWAVEFAEIFAAGGFDVVLANPPYVRADAQFRHVQDDDTRTSMVREWEAYRADIKNSSLYKTLYGKWDLYIPFLERAYQLLRTNGQMIFIISDAFNAAKYAQKSREFFIETSQVERIDFCSDIDIFDAGVQNTILHFAKRHPDDTRKPCRIRRWGETGEDFDRHQELLATGYQGEVGERIFRLDSLTRSASYTDSLPLSMICFISVGMVINAHERIHQGAFTAEDVTSLIPSEVYSRRFIFGKDIEKWHIKRKRYLEWGTKRAPDHFRRQTFPELHKADIKLVAMRTPGLEAKVILDEAGVHFDSSCVGLVPWYQLPEIRNTSIRKSAKYRSEMQMDEIKTLVAREDLENLSRQFDPKYLLAVLNSSFARDWLVSTRRSKRHIYPDDWKNFPIINASPTEQRALALLAQQCIDITGGG